jgi:hypothetical protein
VSEPIDEIVVRRAAFVDAEASRDATDVRV